MVRRFLLAFIFSIPFLNARNLQKPPAESTYEPIFAGTLLAYFAENIPPGKFLLEPYLFVGNINGTYSSNWQKKHTLDNFALQLLWLVETGITPWLDITLITNENYTSSHEKKSYLYGDTRVALGFQI